MIDQHRAFYLSLALVILETVKDSETPKSARWNKLRNCIENVSRAVDIYRPEAWNTADLDNACRVIELCDDLVKQFYPTIEDKAA
jgi:hypothetical protein